MDEISQLMGEALELFRSGHLDRARRSSERAIELCRELNATEPDDPQHRRVLASLLFNHATVLNRMDRRPAALAAILESCRLYEQLVPLDRLAFKALHADALTRAGTTLAALGRAEEAVAFQRSAVAAYESLPPNGVVERGLPRALALLAASQDANDQPDEAIAAATEALGRYEDLHARDELPVDAASYYALAARTLSRLYARRGDWGAATSADAVAVGVYRLLLEQDAPEYADQLAIALADSAAHLSAAGRPDEGVAQVEDAARHVLELDLRFPGRYATAVDRINAVLAALQAT
jgi:tetratricopeptide (TPR) repeat protein